MLNKNKFNNIRGKKDLLIVSKKKKIIIKEKNIFKEGYLLLLL